MSRFSFFFFPFQVTVKDVNESPSFTNLILGAVLGQTPRTVKECKEKDVAPYGCTSTEITANNRNLVGSALTTSDLDTTTGGAGTAQHFGWTTSSHQFSLQAVDPTRRGDVQNLFTIDQSTGQIATKLGAVLDHETLGRVTLYVEVQDQNINGGWSAPIKAEGNLLISVDNINERPTMGECVNVEKKLGIFIFIVFIVFIVFTSGIF